MKQIQSEKDNLFALAYSQHYAAVFGALYHHTHNLEISEELTQEVFIRFYNNMEKVDQTRSWLFATAKYVCYEHYHQQTRHPDEVALIEESDINSDRQAATDHKEVRIILQQAINAISQEQDRTLFDLVSIQKFTHEEAGKLVGLSKRQVKYRHAQVVNELLDALKKKGITSLQELL
ncbi:MAG: RNA polymerase sigma factor [Spirochaetota bacterium]